MHLKSPETGAVGSQVHLSKNGLKPLALTSPPQKPSSAGGDSPPSNPLSSNSNPKSPIAALPLTSPPFRPHRSSIIEEPTDSTSSEQPAPLSLPPVASSGPVASSQETMSVSAPASSQPAEILFNPGLISDSVSKQLPEGYIIRPLAKSDYAAGMLEVLKVLTTVGDISEERWVERFEYMKKREGDYYVIVVEDASRKLVGTGALIAERKFIHNLGMVGHIEDIAVAADQQGKKLGLRIIETLDAIAKEVGCYKSILDCSEKNEGFYVKCGYKRAGLEMAHYY